MNPLYLIPAIAIVCSAADAQEIGHVLSSTPVIQQVMLPQQFCTQESFVVPGATQGGGAVIGAIAGAAVGNAVGHGAGRAASTVFGMVSGAALGNQIDDRQQGTVQQLRRCTTHTTYENQITHYDVVYEYAGKSYAVQMPTDPGPTVQLQVTPIGATQDIAPQPTPSGTYRTPVITSYETIVASQPYGGSGIPVFIALPIYPYAMVQPYRQRPYAGNYWPPRHARTPYPRQTHQPHWR